MASQPSSDAGTLADLIAAADDSVKASLQGGRGLRDFLGSIDKLTPDELNLIVDQAIALLEGFYVHLPLKRAMHAIDPLQRLRLLRRRLPQLSSEIVFHHEMTEIFTSLRDLHTNYLLPDHFSRMVALLPFRVESCFKDGQREYLVSQGAPGFSHPTFVPGVKLTYWNGIPIARAVEIAASYHAGSNPAARHARGVEGLTKRAMQLAPPPDEEWVVIGYLDSQQQPQEFRAEWTITGLPPEADTAVPQAASELAASFGLDLEGDTFRRINKMLFAQHVIAAKRNIEDARRSARATTVANQSARGMAPAEDATAEVAAAETQAAQSTVTGTQSVMPEVFGARAILVNGRSFAYVRIRTFLVQDDIGFVNEFLRLIELPEMPKDGLIIDVRGNGGGLVWAAERLLQFLTPGIIEPCRLQFINTQMNLSLVEAVASLRMWLPSLKRALETGATFSAGFPITPATRCNDIGQRYYGPVVLITDARCYSATDIFAAGFQDHKIGTILGTDNNTGAGGANVWTFDLLRNFFAQSGTAAPLEALPKGTSMRVAIRRTVRVGDESGTELEDLGVRPDEEHELTRDDILNDDLDLLAHAATILSGKTGSKFAVTASRINQQLKIELATQGVEYVDLLIDRRPRGSRNVVSGAVAFDLPGQDATFQLPAGLVDVEVRGYAAGQLACCRRLQS